MVFPQTRLANYQSSLKNLRLFVIIILLIGVFVRIANLDKKPFDGNKFITLTRAGGYPREIVNSIPRDKIITPEEMKKFWQIAPETNLLDTIKITANEAPQHGTLYFVLVRI